MSRAPRQGNQPQTNDLGIWHATWISKFSSNIEPENLLLFQFLVGSRLFFCFPGAAAQQGGWKGLGQPTKGSVGQCCASVEPIFRSARPGLWSAPASYLNPVLAFFFSAYKHDWQHPPATPAALKAQLIPVKKLNYREGCY